MTIDQLCQLTGLMAEKPGARGVPESGAGAGGSRKCHDAVIAVCKAAEAAHDEAMKNWRDGHQENIA